MVGVLLCWIEVGIIVHSHWTLCIEFIHHETVLLVNLRLFNALVLSSTILKPNLYLRLG